MKLFLRLCSFWLAGLCPAILFAQSTSTPALFVLPPHTPYVEGQILFKISPDFEAHCFGDNLNISSLEAILAQLDPISLKQNFPTAPQAAAKKQEDPFYLHLIYELRYAAPVEIASAINLLQSHSAIAYAEPRYIYESFFQPNDPLADTTLGPANQWYLASIQAREAWDVEQGDTTVIVGITDSGTSYDHPDLKQNIAFNHTDPLDGMDNDSDGYVDNYRGWDFAGVDGQGVGDNNATYKDDTHGVNVAGIPGATTNNNFGTAGVGFNCRYLPIKASPDNFRGAITHGYEAIYYAASQGAQIINCSWGGRVKSKVAEDVISYVSELQHVAVVAASGNTPLDLRFYPASFKNVLSVTNTQFGDTACCPAGLGTTYNYAVDVAAPGWKIATTNNSTSFTGFNGTSAASPLASGVVAITLAHFPHYTGLQAAERVRVTTDGIYHIPKNQALQDKLGTGRVNMFRAVTDPLKPSIRLETHELVNLRGTRDFLPGDTIVLSGDFINLLDSSTSDLLLSIEVLDPTQQSFIELITPDFSPGIVQMNEQFSNGQSPYMFRLLSNTPENLAIDLRLRYRDTALNYYDFEYLNFIANSTIVDIAVNRLHCSINSRGGIGYGDFPHNKIGLGVQYGGNERSPLFEGGLLYGTSPTQLAGNIRNATGQQEKDLEYLQRAAEVTPAILSDFEAIGSFDDRGNGLPSGVSVTQRAYAWNTVQDGDYVIIEYEFHNPTPTDIHNFYTGLLLDWDIVDSMKDASYYDNAYKIVYALDVQRRDPAFYGVSLISNDFFRGYARSVQSFNFSDAAKFDAISNAPTSTTATAGTSGTGQNIFHVAGAGPLTLPANGSHKVAFALIAGSGFSHMINIQSIAAQKYRCYVLGEGPTDGFSIPYSQVGVNQSLQFTDLNTTATSWKWNFGDGTTSTLRNPQHMFQQTGLYTVTFSAADGVCEIVTRQQVRVTHQSTDIADNLADDIHLFPNPSKGQFVIRIGESLKGPIRFSVTDLMGHQVLQQGVVHLSGIREVPFDLQQHPDGIYFIKIEGKSFSHSMKWVKD